MLVLQVSTRNDNQDSGRTAGASLQGVRAEGEAMTPKLYDWTCSEHGLFEEFSTYDEATKSVTPVPCYCGETATLTWKKAPAGYMDTYSSKGVELKGQRFHRASEVEEYVADRRDELRAARQEAPKVPDYRGKIKEVVEQVTAKAKAGELPEKVTKNDKFMREIRSRVDKIATD